MRDRAESKISSFIKEYGESPNADQEDRNSPVAVSDNVPTGDQNEANVPGQQPGGEQAENHTSAIDDPPIPNLDGSDTQPTQNSSSQGEQPQHETPRSRPSEYLRSRCPACFGHSLAEG